MTGPASGKIPLRGARIFINHREIKGEVYVHLRGYARARVTHLDIESDELNRVYPSEGGSFLTVRGVDNGIEIEIDKNLAVRVLHPLLNLVLSPSPRANIREKTRTWVGGKKGGIYIGFRKEEIEKLEKIARKLLADEAGNNLS